MLTFVQMASERVALVTGANRGIGFGIVRRLCKEHPNWIVYGTCRNAGDGEEAQKKLKEEGLKAKFLKADVTDENSIISVRDKLLADHGGLDILINNAAIYFRNPLKEPQHLRTEKTLTTNFYGVLIVCEKLFPILRDGARVVFLSSSLALSALHKIKQMNPSRYQSFVKNDPPMALDSVIRSLRDYESSIKSNDFQQKGWPNESAYHISKMANTMLARAYDHEFRQTPARDIVANAADPGYVATSMSNFKGPLTIDEGADTPYYLATLPQHTPIRGQHVANRSIVPWL